MVEWIEMSDLDVDSSLNKVSTLVVEWIEIYKLLPFSVENMSPPSWWSGLKSPPVPPITDSVYVSTLVVEWIEITSTISSN